ncbi:hypothetical protein LY76DRAFT_192048 [Colletotrichum caudatum]|nr:hypothetical protein LY76DRAFT_192048 [Colletotrichum caudatum]
MAKKPLLLFCFLIGSKGTSGGEEGWVGVEKGIELVPGHARPGLVGGKEKIERDFGPVVATSLLIKDSVCAGRRLESI